MGCRAGGGASLVCSASAARLFSVIQARTGPTDGRLPNHFDHLVRQALGGITKLVSVLIISNRRGNLVL
jgi:hypothetical protein